MCACREEGTQTDSDQTIRGGTVELRIETGRWVGMKQKERICAQCSTGEVEDVGHFLLRCMQQCGYRERRVGGANCRVSW